MSLLDFMGEGLAGLGSFQAVQLQAEHTAAIEAQQVAAAHLHLLNQSTSGSPSCWPPLFLGGIKLPSDYVQKAPASRELSGLERREAEAKKKAFPWREV